MLPLWFCQLPAVEEIWYKNFERIIDAFEILSYLEWKLSVRLDASYYHFDVCVVIFANNKEMSEIYLYSAHNICMSFFLHSILFTFECVIEIR